MTPETDLDKIMFEVLTQIKWKLNIQFVNLLNVVAV